MSPFQGEDAGSSPATRSMVAVAQLVELLVVVQAVVGSSPIGHPISFKKEAKASF